MPLRRDKMVPSGLLIPGMLRRSKNPQKIWLFTRKLEANRERERESEDSWLLFWLQFQKRKNTGWPLNRQDWLLNPGVIFCMDECLILSVRTRWKASPLPNEQYLDWMLYESVYTIDIYWWIQIYIYIYIWETETHAKSMWCIWNAVPSDQILAEHSRMSRVKLGAGKWTFKASADLHVLGTSSFNLSCYLAACLHDKMFGQAYVPGSGSSRGRLFGAGL